MKFLAGFVAGLVLASVGAFAQNLLEDPWHQQPGKSFEQQMQEYSIMRDGGTSYQRGYTQQPRNPC